MVINSILLMILSLVGSVVFVVDGEDISTTAAAATTSAPATTFSPPPSPPPPPVLPPRGPPFHHHPPHHFPHSRHHQPDLNDSQRAKLQQIQQNWTKLRKKMCELPSTNSSSITAEQQKLATQLEECNKLNHVYRIQMLLKPCRMIKTNALMNSGNFLDFERAECQFEECHMKVLSSPEYMEIMAELDKMSVEDRMTKAFDRYKCLSKALGVE